jgi:hypothetical protein
MQAYDVYLGRTKIETVFFRSGTSTEEVRRALIEHDGYDRRIVLRKRRGIQGFYTPLRNPSRKRRRNPSNGYIAFYNGKQTEIYADSLYEAKQKAVAFFKPRKSQAHMVHVELAELGGHQVTSVITNPSRRRRNPSPWSRKMDTLFVKAHRKVKRKGFGKRLVKSLLRRKSNPWGYVVTIPETGIFLNGRIWTGNRDFAEFFSTRAKAVTAKKNYLKSVRGAWNEPSRPSDLKVVLLK